MSDEQFWRLLSALDWSVAPDCDRVLDPAIAALATYSEREIEQFEEALARKLHMLDGRRYASRFNPTVFSPDAFLYARCDVVAKGQAFFQAVIEDPGLLNPERDFEAILTLAARAFKRKTGREFRYVPDVSYETYSNVEGWAV
jgi:hypothetical protein